MNNLLKALLFSLTLSLFGCKTNSITGRSQLDLVSETEVQAMALTQYKEFLSKNPVVASTNAPGNGTPGWNPDRISR